MAARGVAVEYLATGANRQTAAADWNDDGLLAFGADVNVALWRPCLNPPRGIEAILSGHKAVVKAVRFLPGANGDDASYLISGSDDAALIVWKKPALGARQQYSLVQTCAEHTGSINCIAALRPSADRPRWIVATGAADATIRVWSLADSQLKLLQTLHTAPKFFPLALSLAPLADDGSVALAAAGTRDFIQILTSGSADDAVDFALQTTLYGHEGWIRSLCFAQDAGRPGSDLLLASASQDKYVRIWRFHQGQELPALAASSSDVDSSNSGVLLPGASPSNKAYWLKSRGRDWSVTFEALLLGHEDWVYSAAWHRPLHDTGAGAGAALQLLSTSADNSLAIWEADPSSGIWVSRVRLGEISREKGATTATGSTGGFWTGLWSPDGSSVACLGRTGSWRRWQHEAADDSWRPCVAVSGHTKAVTGIAWSPTGSYLLSTSSDQTTRLHTQWIGSGHHSSWHEMSRPQIHGYDLNCIDSLDDSSFVSGADEKLMRVFTEPRAVAVLLDRLAGVAAVDMSHKPVSANIPVLGLSNKALDAVDDDDRNVGKHREPGTAAPQEVDDGASSAVAVAAAAQLDLHHPPLEETLSRHTLWPETEKLYGHGYELSCLAVSGDAKVVASACKASSTNYAVIRLFETRNCTEVKPPLTAHSLTTTRLRFSPGDEYLLSVGRDRQWAVFARQGRQHRRSSSSKDVPIHSNEGDAEAPTYKLLQSNVKAHSRMILDAAWAPRGAGPLLFATAGRDKQVRLWAAQHAATDDGEAGDLRFAQVAAIACLAPVTAVDFLPHTVGGSTDDDGLVLAVGTEAGRLSLYTVRRDGSGLLELAPPLELFFPSAVLQLSWRPGPARGNGTRYVLAAAGADSSLRLFSFDETSLRRSEGPTLKDGTTDSEK